MDPRVTLGPWLAQVHTYPVGTWNSSECAPKCFATHKNGTHLHWYTPTLSVHGTTQSLPQSALQLTRMAPISIGQLVHTYPVGTWNSSESAPKCFATHKNGTHLHCVLDPPVTLGPWLAQVHTYPVDTWNSSESAPKCFATHKNGTHLHWSACTHLPFGYMEQLRVCPKVLCNSQEWHPSSLVSLYTPTLWVHGTSQSLPQSALQLTRMAPIFTGQLMLGPWLAQVHTYPVGTWNSSESASNVLDPRVTLGPWLAQVHTYPVGTWNSSESAPKCFATHKNGTHLHWYTPTLWVHGIAQSLPQSALQLTRMAPISIGQLVHTYPVGTWNSSESAPKCFATHKNGTHLHCSESAPKCFATHKNGTHLHWSACTQLPCGYMEQLSVCLKVLCNSQEWHPSRLVSFVLDPRVTLGLRLAQVHTYPVGTWNSSESAPKCFATHKNGTHLHCVPNPRVTLGPWLAQVHTYPVGTWNSSESASKCFATHKNGTHFHCASKAIDLQTVIADLVCSNEDNDAQEPRQNRPKLSRLEQIPSQVY
ncbi:hypothetical protein EMCRGX_G017576 [Ephydatia muelleri]